MAAALAALLVLGTNAMAAEGQFPVVRDYGGIHPPPQAQERPDRALHYKVVFSITQAAPQAGKLNPSLEKVARFLNLLGGDGVRVRPGDVVAIVHDKATPLVLNDAAYRAKFGMANPNLELIHRLKDAGAEVHVCSQALAGMKIPLAAVDGSVQIDLAALTTLANLQLRGYALIPD